MATETNPHLLVFIVQDWTDGAGKLDSMHLTRERAKARADEIAESTLTHFQINMGLEAKIERRGFRHEEPLAVSTSLRSPEAIAVAEEEMRQRIWYDNFLRSGATWGLNPETDATINQARRLSERRPDLGPAKNDLERAEWYERLATLRWVLGEPLGSTDVN